MSGASQDYRLTAADCRLEIDERMPLRQSVDRQSVNHLSALDNRQSRSLEHVLSTYWGYTSFRPLQREAMDAVLDGRDSVVVLPTGGGKSLCFQAPAVLQPPAPGATGGDGGFALVVSPLISLMKDQVDGLRVDGVAASFINSTQTGAERDEVVAGLRQGRCRLLYVSPERLVGEGSQGFRRLLQQCRVRLIAIDEAHCISQWGHDFRPDYRQLGQLR